MTSRIARDGQPQAPFGDAEIDRIVERMELVGTAARLRILVILSQGESGMMSLCGATALSQPGISHHLALLRTAGLVNHDRRGKQ